MAVSGDSIIVTAAVVALTGSNSSSHCSEDISLNNHLLYNPIIILIQATSTPALSTNTYNQLCR